MRSYADDLIKYIIGEAKEKDGTLRFILPSYPADLLFKVGTALAEQIMRIKGKRVQFIYGIAYQLGEKWRTGNHIEKQIYMNIVERGWYNETDNLTELRHRFCQPDEDCLVILLAGYDDIRDQASLGDFFHLDQRIIWETSLKKSFSRWVSQTISEYIDPEGNKGKLEVVADIFHDLYSAGLADPLSISYYLDNKDFSMVLDGRDVLKEVLVDLSVFGLPNMIGFQNTVRRRFSDYLIAARKFIDYSSFIEETKKRRALKNIKESSTFDVVEPDRLGNFDGLSSMISCLESYVKLGSKEDRDKLVQADFVLIDEILKSPKTNPTRRDREKKITGTPLEVVLNGLWQALREYKQENNEVYLSNSIRSIRIACTKFTHQYGKEDDDEAFSFLRKLIGGLDRYLSDHIDLKREDGSSIEISSVLFPGSKDGLILAPAKTSIPSLSFEVTVHDGEKAFKKKCRWVLGKNCLSRFLIGLYDWALKGKFALPVFSIDYINEMHMVNEEEDVIRIFTTALEKQAGCVNDLLSARGIDANSSIYNRLFKLREQYEAFLSEYNTEGYIAALANKSDAVRKAYYEALKEYTERSPKSPIGPLLFKAFMFVPRDYIKDDKWQWNEALKSCVVTPLHPALLEMLLHQHAYLCSSFCYHASAGLNDVGRKGLLDSKWRRLVDLAQIKWPVAGTLGENGLIANIKSYGYIHLVGNAGQNFSNIGSRLLVKYEEDESEDITDEELFYETQEGMLLRHILLEYCTVHSHGNDGLSVGVYTGGSIQPIIGGIDSFLMEITQRVEYLYTLTLTLFSDRPDDESLLALIEAWQQRWHGAEGSARKSHYEKCKITVRYQVVAGGVEQLEKLIGQSDFDVMFFIAFTKPFRSKFKPFNASYSFDRDDFLKFPILEKVNCAVTDSGKDQSRELVLNNRRFRATTIHAEVMAILCSPYDDSHRKHFVVSETDFSLWKDALNKAHSNSVWVVCIDSVVDEKLIINQLDSSNRDIIGFGTGVGPHGELNFTVSTERFYLSDLTEKVSKQLMNIYNNNDYLRLRGVAEALIKLASTLSGLSIVKATGPSEYVRDFIAYTLVRKLLPIDEGIFCDEVISLDAFLHWFDYSHQTTRPDLLRLQARVIDGCFTVKIQVIECKLAQQSDNYLEDAHKQIEEGLKQLIPKLAPRHIDIPIGINSHSGYGYPPDQRYWWMQLHRLIASRGEISTTEYDQVLPALEMISDGCYDIEWGAAAFAFWTDASFSGIDIGTRWTFRHSNQEMPIYTVQCGKEIIHGDIALDVVNDLFSAPGLNYKFKRCLGTESDHSGIIAIADAESTFRAPANDLVNEVNAVLPTGGPILAVSNIPKQIYLGSGPAGGRKVFWEFGHDNLPNRHLLIFGASGTGKTYTVQALMAELSKNKANSLIVDYSNGFTTNQLESVIIDKLAPQQHIIRSEPLPINPFRKQSIFVDGIPIEDTSVQIAQRVSGVFSQVYTLGEQQKAVLYNAIKDGIETHAANFNLAQLVALLEDVINEGGMLANSAISLINKIGPFVDMNPFGQESKHSWEKLYLDQNSKSHIIQLAGFMKDSARLITEFALIDLYWYYRGRGSKDEPRVIVLDEIQNLDHSLTSPLGQLLTEGRKFGISLILATQTLSNLSKEEKDRLFQASHKLFFKPADTEVKTFAQLLADATHEKVETWVHQLSRLQRGECYSLGNAYNPVSQRLEVNKAFKIKIDSLENRF